MQLSLTFPDSGYPDVLFIATNDSLAKDALEAAAEEWLVDSLFLEISYLDDFIHRSSALLSKGVVADSQLTVSLLRWIGKELLTDAPTREKVGNLIKAGSFGPDRVLRLDTPTFADDRGCLHFEAEWVPDGILSICFANPNPSITSTAPNFLKKSNITNVDLLGLQSITSVGDSFLMECSSLATVDLNFLQHVTSIGDDFMRDCVSLTSVNLLFFESVESIGDCFLRGCSLLETVDLSAFQKVTCINRGFLAQCESLKEISNTSGLRSVKSIGNGFLGLCSSLVSVDISVFENVESIGETFLLACKSLETVDLGAFEKVTRINKWFLAQCESLREVSNIFGLRNVESVGECFLDGCNSLCRVEVSASEWQSLKSEYLKKRFAGLRMVKERFADLKALFASLKVCGLEDQQ